MRAASALAFSPLPMKLPPTMPMMMPISVSTTRISISVMPRCRNERAPAPRRRMDVECMANSFALDEARTGAPCGRLPDFRLRSLHKFAHAHHAEQDREHDAPD